MLTAIKKYRYPIILAGLFLLQFIFINPIGEFPLNDDWVHTDTIKHWIETGEFRMLPFAGPTFYMPILYGALLTKLFGFSFSLLRISTLVLAAGTLSLFYYTLRRQSVPASTSFVATLTLWFNPIFYNLSFTFMADIPAVFFLMAAIVLYLQGFAKNNTALLLLASVAAVAGAYTRQTTVLILFAALLYGITQRPWIGTKKILLAFGLPIVLGAITYTLLSFNELLPQSTGTHIIEGAGRLFGHMRWWSWYIPLYLGLFLMPISFAWLAANKDEWKNRKLQIFVVLALLIALGIRELYHLQLPYVINMISLYSLGPIAGVIQGNASLLFTSFVWGILTMASAASLGILAYFFVTQKNPAPELRIVRYFIILSLIPLLLFESFDRYLLPLVLGCLIVLSVRLKQVRIALWAANTILIIFALYSISQTAFYLSFHSVRWNLAQDAISAYRMPLDRIDAGYEWNGWYTYWAEQTMPPKEAQKNDPWWIRQLFTHNTLDYIISLSPKAGYIILETRTIPGFNPNNSLFLLKKISE